MNTDNSKKTMNRKDAKSARKKAKKYWPWIHTDE